MGIDSGGHTIQKRNKKYKNKRGNSIKKPDFFIVGAPRSGTTAMWRYLQQHPDIFMPGVKDAAFFGEDLKYKHGRLFRDLNDYLKMFRGATGGQIAGDACVAYLNSKTAAEEIKEFNPAAKIIIMLRNPVEQMYSNYKHQLWEGNENIKDFEEALRAEDARKKGKQIPADTNYLPALLYREGAKYAPKVKRYLDTFGKENVHIIIFDDFVKDTAAVYAETLKFLRVDENFTPEFKRINENKGVRLRVAQKMLGGGMPSFITTPIKKIIPWTALNPFLEKLKKLNAKPMKRRPLEKELKEKLLQEFRSDIDELSELIGRDLSFWYKL